MYTRRTFLNGIKYMLPIVVASKVDWLTLIEDGSSGLASLQGVVPDYAQVLIGMRMRLSDPASWCQRVYKEGNRRCLIGALIEELNLQSGTSIEIEEGQHSAPDFDDYHTSSGHFLYLAKRELFPDFVWRGLDRWNDDPDTSHDDVLRVIDRAIECAVDRDVHEEALERTNWEIC